MATIVKEDLSTYTEVDPNGRLTVTADKAEAINAGSNENVYLYTDKGIDTLDNIYIEFEILIDSASAGSAYGGVAVTNTVATIAGLATTDVFIVGTSGGSIILGRGNWVTSDNYACAEDVTYYCTFHRIGDSAYCRIYSDAARTILLDTLTIAGIGAVTKWRYLFGFINYNAALGGQRFDGYVQNVYGIELPVARWDFFTWG